MLCCYFAVQAVMIHQLSKQATQNPFRKNRGRVSRVLFHPSKPFLLVATEHHVRVYNLVKQALARKLVGSSGGFTCLAIHSSGDHVLAGALDHSRSPDPDPRAETCPSRAGADVAEAVGVDLLKQAGDKTELAGAGLLHA